MENVEKVAVDETYASLTSLRNKDSSSADKGSEDENAIHLFGSDTKIHDNQQSSTTSTTEKAKIHAKQEVLSYLIATESIVKWKFDPL